MATNARSKSARTRKPTAEERMSRTVLGLFMLGLGGLLFACQLMNSRAPFIVYSREVLQGLSGALCLLTPALFCLIGGMLVFSGKRTVDHKRVWCVVVLYFLVLTLIHLFSIEQVRMQMNAQTGDPNSYLRFLQYSWQTSSVTGSGGGVLGALLAAPLYTFLDMWGAILLLAVLIITDLVILTGVSFDGTGGVMGDWWAERKEIMAENREQRAAERAERAEQKRLALLEEEALLYDEPPPRPKSKRSTIREVEPEPAPAPRGRGKRVPVLDPDDLGDGEDYDLPGHDYAPEEPPARKQRRKPQDDWEEQQQKQQLRQQGQFLRASTPGSLYVEDIVSGKARPEPIRAQAAQAAQARRAAPPTGGLYIEDVTPFAQDDWAPPSDSLRKKRVPIDAMPLRDEPQDGPQDELPVASYDWDDEGPDEAPIQPAHKPRRVATHRDSAPQTPATPYQPAASVEPPPRERRLDETPLQFSSAKAEPEPEIEPYRYPPMNLLKAPERRAAVDTRASDAANARKLIETLASFGIQATMENITHGPAITRYELKPAPGVKVSRIVGLVDDIALNMASAGVRIEAPIPGKPAVGVEIPNESIATVTLREVLDSDDMDKQTSPLSCALGKDIAGRRIIADLAKMPHVLIAGATGSGKSVCINTLISSMIFRSSPEQVRMILVDPKVVELSVYNGIPHLLLPVVTDPKKAAGALSWAVSEMEQRYKKFAERGVRDIRGFNANLQPDEEMMPQIVVIIDELADLMMVAPGEVEESICRLAQLARAAGIHLVIATQRPSVNVITGVIKANIPSRIAFAVSSQVDSRTILDGAGAEKLLGKGDMLYAPSGTNKPTRVQGCFVSDDEVSKVVEYVKKRHSTEYSEDVIEYIESVDANQTPGGGASDAEEVFDEYLADAVEMAVESGQASISMLQRRLRVGYARAGRLIDEMARRGIVAQAEGAKPRQVLITREEYKRMFEME